MATNDVHLTFQMPASGVGSVVFVMNAAGDAAGTQAVALATVPVPASAAAPSQAAANESIPNPQAGAVVPSAAADRS